MRRISRILKDVGGLSVVAFFLGTGTVSASPALLGSYDEVSVGASAPQSASRVQFVLQLSPSVPLPLESAFGLGVGIWWEDGSHGSVDFTRNNSDAFLDFATSATDGLDSRFASITGFFNGNPHGVIGAESTLFGRSPDLAGYDLELVRLIVHDVRFEPIMIDEFEGFSVESAISYEFYGTPIPEPATLVLVACGFAVLSGQNRRSRTRLVGSS